MRTFIICHMSPAATANAITSTTGASADVPAETMDNSGLLLRDAQMSSFGRKRKLHNMANVSVCLCGELAAPTASNAHSDVVCCQIPATGCETKWVSHNPLFQEVCLPINT
jgi:hypothetical protein